MYGGTDESGTRITLGDYIRMRQKRHLKKNNELSQISDQNRYYSGYIELFT